MPLIHRNTNGIMDARIGDGSAKTREIQIKISAFGLAFVLETRVSPKRFIIASNVRPPHERKKNTGVLFDRTSRNIFMFGSCWSHKLCARCQCDYLFRLANNAHAHECEISAVATYKWYVRPSWFRWRRGVCGCVCVMCILHAIAYPQISRVD